MSDIVERLTNWAEQGDMGRGPSPTDLRRLAAAEITRLRSELATARKDALEEAAKVAEGFEPLDISEPSDYGGGYYSGSERAFEMVASAIRALGEE